MSKTGKRSVGGRGARRRSQVVPRKRAMRVKGGISKDALGYKRLLLDPCNAPLIKTPYEGNDGSSVQRGVGLGLNAAAYQVQAFHPLYGMWEYSTANSAAANSFTQFGSFPRYVAGARAIAGCHSSTYVGPESTRQGLVYCGVVPGSLVWSNTAASSGGGGGSISPDALVSRIVNYERMPVDKCEVNWFPGEGDSDLAIPYWGDLTSVAAQEAAWSKTHFTILVNYNVSTASVQTKAVSVVEQSSNQAVTGYAAYTVGSAVKPTYDWRAVLSSLSEQDTTWYLGTFRKVGNFISGVARGYITAGLPGALGYLTQSVAGAVTASRERMRSNL